MRLVRHDYYFYYYCFYYYNYYFVIVIIIVVVIIIIIIVLRAIVINCWITINIIIIIKHSTIRVCVGLDRPEVSRRSQVKRRRLGCRSHLLGPQRQPETFRKELIRNPKKSAR